MEEEVEVSEEEEGVVVSEVSGEKKLEITEFLEIVLSTNFYIFLPVSM